MKKNSALIELTPLLDVILILLFFILVQNAGQMDVFYDETREALQAEFEAEITNLETSLDAALTQHAHDMEQMQIISASYDALRIGLEEDSGVILVSIVSEVDDMHTRWISVEAGNYVTRIDLSWNTLVREYATRQLNETLTNKINDMPNSVIILVFRYNSASTFTSDLMLVDSAIHIQRQFNQLVVAELDVRI